MHGVLQPILLRKKEDNVFEIIAGECRFRAAKLANLEKMPAFIINVDDETALAFGIIENIQRKSLNPIDEAKSFKQLIEEFRLTHEEVAVRVSRKRVSITNSLRLLTLPIFSQTALINKKIEIGHAKAIMSLSDEEQEILIAQIKRRKLSVRQTEKISHRLKKGGSLEDSLFPFTELEEVRKDVVANLPWSCQIAPNKKGYSIKISVGNLEEMKEILSLLKEK